MILNARLAATSVLEIEPFGNFSTVHCVEFTWKHGIYKTQHVLEENVLLMKEVSIKWQSLFGLTWEPGEDRVEMKYHS